MNGPSAAAAVRLVTVSASYGAGGSIIAPRLAQELDLPFADRLIGPRTVPVAAVPATASDEASAEDEPRKSFFSRLAHLNAGLNFPLPRDPADLRDHIRERVEGSIGELVTSGGAVILGRAASVVLGGHPRAYHVRLDGPVERRARRGAMWEDIDIATARSRLEETDGARERYIRRLYQRDPTEGALYHLVLDTTVLTMDDCVAVIGAAARAFWTAEEA